MVLNTNLGHLGSYIEAKSILMVYSDYSFKKICIPLNCSWSDKTPYASKEDSEYWLISFGEVYRYFFIHFTK